MLIKRDFYLNKLIKSKNNKRIKVITGIRRVGKSFLLNELYYSYLLENGVSPEQIIKIPLDNISNIKYRNPILLAEYINSKISDNLENYIFIDEIQFVETIKNPYIENNYIGFYEVLNEFLNKNNVDVYVTGSNSRMLSKDVLTEFRGRGDQIHVMPLSIYELKLFSDKSFESLYQDYQIYGGLPYALSLLEDIEKRSI